MKKKFIFLMGAFLVFTSSCTKDNDKRSNNSNYSEIIKVESWDVEITLSVVGPSSVRDEAGVTHNHDIEMVSYFEGTLTAYPDFIYTPATRIWKLTDGNGTGRISDVLFSVYQGVSTKFTRFGTRHFDVQELMGEIYGLWNSIILDMSSESGYRIIIPEFSIDTEWTLYEPNKPYQIFDGPNQNKCSIIGAELENIEYPEKGTILKGNQTIKNLILDAGEMDVNITWEFYPTIVLTPLEPVK